MAELKLVIFDVDGTLVDSIGQIELLMARAFRACDLPEPAPGAVRNLIGVSLVQLLDQLHPGLSPDALNRLAMTYKQIFATESSKDNVAVTQPLFPGALEVLNRLHARENMLLAVATGKSRRGLNRLLDGYDLTRHFVTTQVADDHPSKPHPSMIHKALADTGLSERDAVIVGDTTYDLDMGHAAGVTAIGVTWGNHPPDILRNRADHMLEDFSQLDPLLDKIWAT